MDEAPTQPPFANRGVVTLETTYKRLTDAECIVPRVARLDFLTLSVGEDVAADLVAATEPREEGGRRPGFRMSELRECLGGTCWRRWEPVSASKRWGFAYESWEWASDVAHWAVHHHTGYVPKGGRASRVDVAWDVVGPGAMTADRLVEVLGVERFAESRGISMGVSGQGGINTRYVGAATSDRRVRMYRRDLHEGGSFMGELPEVRVELVLRGEPARAWFELLERDRDAAWDGASAHLADMTGIEFGRVGEIPTIEPEPERDEAQAVFQFLLQHGDMVQAWLDAGLDLADVNRSLPRRACRMRSSRARRRAARFASVDWDAVRVQVERLAVLHNRRQGWREEAGGRTLAQEHKCSEV